MKIIRPLERRVKPIHVLFEEGFKPADRRAVLNGIERVLQVGRVDRITIAENPLGIDPVEYARRLILREIKKSGVYNIAVVHSPLYSALARGSAEGLTRRGLGALISSGSFRDLRNHMDRYERIRRVAMHETGHVFGLVPKDRENVAEDRFHCVNECVMDKQGRYPNFCEPCEEDLVKYFREG
jgi:peptide methionine sulfoxide reductase MsrB